MNIVNLTHDEINYTEVIASVSSPKCGATTMFIGTTRDNFEGKMVQRLEYEAYEPMAKAEMEKICNRIREKWEVEHIAVTHRLENVPVCSASVVVAISSAHRKESLEACQYAIDELKSFAPIWKKEVYEDQNENEEESSWKANVECFWSKNEKEPTTGD